MGPQRSYSFANLLYNVCHSRGILQSKDSNKQVPLIASPVTAKLLTNWCRLLSLFYIQESVTKKGKNDNNMNETNVD